MKSVRMVKKPYHILCLICFLLLIAGCNSEKIETDILTDEDQATHQGEGILTGIIDSNSVEIQVGGLYRVFALVPEIQIEHILAGTKVEFLYIEDETRPIIKSIWPVYTEMVAEGIFTGLIDSHSVEIKVNDQYVAFAIGEDIDLSAIDSGSNVRFKYQEGGPRPVLLEISATQKPVPPVSDEKIAEGIFIGQIDSQSVEIQLNRVFVLGSDVSVENIEDGAFVAFAFTESGPRAVLEMIKKVEQALEGDVMHGTYIGQVDSQSVEIVYYQAFSLGDNVEIRQITDGSEVIITYRESLYRPVLISIKEK